MLLLQQLKKEVIRSGRESHGHRLVYVVSQQQKAASLHDDIQFGAIGSSFWSARRLGPWTDLVSPLHTQLYSPYTADLLQL